MCPRAAADRSMSAIPQAIPDELPLEPVHGGNPRPSGLPRRAQIYLLVVGIGTIAAAGRFYVGATSITHEWAVFVVLAAAATIAHTFPVKSPSNAQYHTSVVFLVAAALLLPPELLVLIPLVQTIPEWLKERTPWPIQGFNIANYTLDSLAAWGLAHLVLHHAQGTIGNSDARFAVGGLVAAVAFMATNHFLVAMILKLSRGHSFRESRLFTVDMLSVDVVLAILGVSVAAFWNWNPWLIF